MNSPKTPGARVSFERATTKERRTEKRTKGLLKCLKTKLVLLNKRSLQYFAATRIEEGRPVVRMLEAFS
ncbi:hypothetical protein SAMN05444359_11284 [Neolewinella agarilytica]|uniref:Uncharacterized protein n=1 Tax=Neolewinella agarilytica TaxID=478744 RepID=A0A1H9HAT8_9BACT|nr:hypothetical protein SAMN05444359_11284 [Neolewinella agarilytica]